MKLQEDFLQKPSTKEETFVDAVSQPTPRRKLPTIPPTTTQRPLNSPPHKTAEGVVGEHIFDTYVWQKMLCALNVTGEAIIVHSVSLPQLQ